MRIVAAILLFVPLAASAHDWIEDGNYRSVHGVRCCSELWGDSMEHEHTGGAPDCAAIPDALAWGSRVGSVIDVPLAYGPVPTTINVIYPSRDPLGRAMACTTGCLFRPPGL